jgi:hypothetical protein
MTDSLPQPGDNEATHDATADPKPSSEPASGHGNDAPDTNLPDRVRPSPGDNAPDKANVLEHSVDHSGSEEDDAGDDESEDGAEEDEEDDEEDEEEEPKLKYARLTQHLGPVYRNGDATSSFFVAGDKMVVFSGYQNLAQGLFVADLPLRSSARTMAILCVALPSRLSLDRC